MAVVKSNAYGHDIYQFAAELEKLGADYLAVDSVVEGEALRQAGIQSPILVLGYTLPAKFVNAHKHNLSITVSQKEGLLMVANTPTRFHLKVDTGMHRQGFLPTEIPSVLKFLKQHKVPAEYFEGLYTHFAAAKNPAFPKDTRDQANQFKEVIKLVEAAGYRPIKHAAASSGTILFPDTHFDAVRIGISLYGLWPSAEVAAAVKDHIHLEPALTWKTLLSEVKKLKRGDRIGYDFTETLEKNTIVGICPIGYWHGYPRLLSSIGRVVVNGRRCRVLGRVSMDMIMVDLGPQAKEVAGTEVMLLGGDYVDQNKSVSADELAALTGTSCYEIVTRLNPLIKRIYL